MQLSHKQKTFSEFVSTFLKFRLKFQDFQKKDDHRSWCISLNYALRKTWFKKSIKSPLSEDPSTSNM